MKEAISSPHAPKAIGPYSPAIRAEGWVYVSGQIPIDPATGNLVQGDISAQTTQVMKNLKALLEAAGSGFDQVVKTTVYLKSMNDFTAMNEIYGRHFAAAAQAAGADAHTMRRRSGILQTRLHRAQIHVPAPLGDVVSVADVVAKLRPFAADVANSCHDCLTPGRIRSWCRNYDFIGLEAV